MAVQDRPKTYRPKTVRDHSFEVQEPQRTAIASNKEAGIGGVISAAFLSSGIGCLTIGMLTTGAVISEALKNMLNWWNPAGPLAGKTGIGVAIWLMSWFILHLRWRNNKEIDFGKIFVATLILIGIGFILTFPPVFEAFE